MMAEANGSYGELDTVLICEYCIYVYNYNIIFYRLIWGCHLKLSVSLLFSEDSCEEIGSISTQLYLHFACNLAQNHVRYLPCALSSGVVVQYNIMPTVTCRLTSF